MRPLSDRSSPAAVRPLTTWLAVALAWVLLGPCPLPAIAADIAAPPVPADGADFRAVRWGASAAAVRKSEPGSLLAAEGPLLVFRATAAGHDCRVIYFFRDDKLCMGFYQWSDTHADLAPYFDDATALRAQLSAVYDEPPIERWDWDDPMFAEQPDLRAEALGLGLVRYELGWMSERSIVALRLSGGDLKADILVMYADRRCFPDAQNTFGAFFSGKVGVPTPYYR